MDNKGGGQKVNIGDLRRYTELTFDLHLSAQAEEKNPPAITVSYVNASCISVNATDESGIEKLVRAYTDNTGNWDSFDIVPDAVACALEEEIELEAGKEYFVQAVDIYGNVAVDDNEGRYYTKNVVDLDDELNYASTKNQVVSQFRGKVYITHISI